MAQESDPRQVNAVLLIEVAKLMAKSMASGPKITHVLHLLSKWSKLHFPRVLLPNYQTRELEVAYYYGLPHEKVATAEYTVPFDQGLTGYVWRSGQVALVTDVLSEPVFLTRIAEPIEGSKHHVGYISVPIMVDGKTVGVLSAQRRANPRRRYADDVDLLRVIASLLGPVLQSLRHRAQHISLVPGQLDRDSDHFIQLCEAHGIIGSSRALLSAVKEIDQVKDSDAPIMLLGESGTGKEMFAGMAHRESRRRKKPFICINCASIPEALLESELFGHEKGSFTGAHRRQVGKIEQAHEGTLFLDEIGDMPMDLQVKLLRVLQDKHIQPIGSDRPRHVDFRLITATHVNLGAAVQEGRFRLDLYYRLNVIPIALPPLRKRQEDIPRLAQHFLNLYAETYDRSLHFTQGVYERLQRFPWPGNIRQLQNVVERAVLKAEGQWVNVEQIEAVLDAELIPDGASLSGQDPGSARAAPEPVTARPYQWVRDADIESLQDALRQAAGNQTRAARLLGLTPRQFRYRLKKLQVEC
jgi:Nif-specific regulatory protein